MPEGNNSYEKYHYIAIHFQKKKCVLKQQIVLRTIILVLLNIREYVGKNLNNFHEISR